jgi:hypothetical protein
MLSSTTSIIGNKGQGNYVSGCGFQDTIANTTNGSTRFVALNLPLIAGSENDISNPFREQNMFDQGVTKISVEELLVSLDYALQPPSKEQGSTQLIMGIGVHVPQNMVESRSSSIPLFKHLVKTSQGGAKAVGSDEFDRTNAHIGLNADLPIEEIHDRMTIAIAHRISTLIAVDYADIELDAPIVDFGLDSLVAIELKTWITRTFQTTTMETSEILGMSSTRALAQLTAQRSTVINASPPKAE